MEFCVGRYGVSHILVLYVVEYEGLSKSLFLCFLFVVLCGAEFFNLSIL